jgi:hypothetical protein
MGFSDDAVQVTASIEDSVLTQAGFSTLAILNNRPLITDKRVETFTTKDGLLEKHDASTQVYKCANAERSQPKQTARFKVIAQYDGESVVEALTAAKAADWDWFGYDMVSRNDADILAAAEYLAGQDKLMGYCTENADCKTDVSTSIGAIMTGASYEHVFGMWHHEAGIELANLSIVIAEGFATISGNSVKQVERVTIDAAADQDYIVTLTVEDSEGEVQDPYPCTYTSAGSESIADIRAGIIDKINSSAPGIYDTGVIATEGTNPEDIDITAKDAGTGFVITVGVNLSVVPVTANSLSAHNLREGNKVTLMGVLVDEAESEDLNKDHSIEIISNDQFKVPTTEAGAVTGEITAHARCTYPSAAWIGRMFPEDEGSDTWNKKTLTGIQPSNDYISETEKGYLAANKMNWYINVGGLSLTRGGRGKAAITHSGRFIDLERGKIWFKTRVQEAIYNLDANKKGYGFDAAGYAKIEGAILKVAKEGVTRKYLRMVDGQPCAITIPKPEDLGADLVQRILSGTKVWGRILGKVHDLDIAITLGF